MERPLNHLAIFCFNFDHIAKPPARSVLFTQMNPTKPLICLGETRFNLYKNLSWKNSNKLCVTDSDYAVVCSKYLPYRYYLKFE